MSAQKCPTITFDPPYDDDLLNSTRWKSASYSSRHEIEYLLKFSFFENHLKSEKSKELSAL
jgi:hypothetical protein